jgi:hypothetical protein
VHLPRIRVEDVALYSYIETDQLWRALIVERDRRGYRRESECPEHFKNLACACLVRQRELAVQLELF